MGGQQKPIRIIIVAWGEEGGGHSRSCGADQTWDVRITTFVQPFSYTRRRTKIKKTFRQEIVAEYAALLLRLKCVPSYPDQAYV